MVADPARLDSVLRAESESGEIEFKQLFNPGDARGWLELVRAIVAMANSGGGGILYGVDNRGTPVREPVEVVGLDPLEITRKIHKYTEHHFDSFEICKTQKDGQSVAAIIVGGVGIPMIFAKPGTYPDGNGQKTVFAQGTLYFRHGAESCPGTTDDLRDAVDRLRREWAKGVQRAADAPLGSIVEVRSPTDPTREGGSPTSIRLTDDPTVPVSRMVNPNQTHLYRTQEIVQKINEDLSGFRVNVYDVTAIRVAHGLDQRLEMVHKPRHGSRVFSSLFAEWVVGSIQEDRGFIRKARREYRAQRRTR